ncbi:MAG: hypothetical protein BWY00_01490 [Firmicutes bacterium ADurb.Bin153]|nr:MAG: hypothetical protein BWY00_01490 [Firmicutes bacterium ADurb.Bin153]
MGPVWSLSYMGNGNCILVGKVFFDVTNPNPVDGYDYINMFDISDGRTVAQFKAVEPFIIRLIKPLSQTRALVAADYSGLVSWNIKDKYLYEWRLKSDPPKYICAGLPGTALIVGKDGKSLSTIDTRKGTQLKQSPSAEAVLGEPIFVGSRYYVPVNGGLLVLGTNLETVLRYGIEGLKGSVSLVPAKDSIYIAGDDLLVKYSVK